MDPRSRALAVLRGQKADVVPWYGDLDYWLTYLRAEKLLPERYQGDGLYQLHRDLGVGFYLQGYFPFRAHYEGVRVTEESNDNLTITRVETPVGTLRAVEKYLPESYCKAYEERFVKDWRDLKPLRYWCEHTHYEPDYSLAARRYDLIGDYGLVLCYLPRSPLMELVAITAGIRAVTYALADAPEEFAETFAALERKNDEACQIALDSPAECLMIPENLSSETVGKRLYNQYVRPHDERWARRIKEAGKHSFIHMDGTLRGLIREVSATGFHVLEALTPAPVGDIPIEEIGGWLAGDAIVWGGLPGVYFTDLVSDAEFDAFVLRVLAVMRREPRYVLGVADQVPPGSRMGRIARVAKLVEQYGSYE